MHFVFFLEEPSAEATLQALLPRLLGSDHTFRLHVHPGKQNLLKHLPKRLRGYARAPEDRRFVVLLDRDREDCHQLKSRLEEMTTRCGFSTPSSPSSPDGARLVNRIVVAELEAWFLGDPEALRTAFPGVSGTFERKQAYRHPDRIPDPARRLESLLQKAGHYPAGLAKIDAARRIAPHLEPTRNSSRSFQVLLEGLATLAGGNLSPGSP